MHPRWIAPLCVAFRANSAAIPPSKRLASPAPRRSRCSCGFIHALLALLVSFAGPPLSASAQELLDHRSVVEGVADLAERCHGGNSRLVSRCRELALAAMAVQQGAGLASALGSDIPGTPSTLGRRLGTVPRVGLSVSGLGLRVGVPRVAASSAQQLREEENFALVGLRGTAAAGVLDGFQLSPGVGGILSVDLIGSYTLLRLPESSGFAGRSSGVGLGARVGILRESFTLPGISVSGARRWHGNIQLGDIGEGDAGEVETDLVVSSLRATLGKNWFVLGLMGGVGWDRYEGNAMVSAPRGAGDSGSVDGHIASERILYFAAGWFNFLISQLSVEIGMAEGVEDPFANRRGEYDPLRRTWFAATAFRVTL